MARAFLLVMDSLGIGASADAGDHDSLGADTLGHVARARASGSTAGSSELVVPNLDRLGLGLAARLSTGRLPAGFGRLEASGAYGFAVERSLGKDTPSGHWEMAGVPVAFAWTYFPATRPSFPAALTDAIIAAAGIPGFLGNCHASGTAIIDELGATHLRTGMPILYTSADSVLQIAAHEEHFGLDRLHALCRAARVVSDEWNIGRVIARPFVGTPGAFVRTANRRDFAVPPPEPTLLDRLTDAGREVRGIGKISDIFAARGITRSIKTADDDAGMAATIEAAREAPDGALVFTNLNDLDTLYGHRRNAAGYAAALERIDALLPGLEAAMRPGDIAIITADHGCDPTAPGTDHTREHVPVLMFGPAVTPRALGRRESFADIGQTIADHLGIAKLAHGASFLR